MSAIVFFALPPCTPLFHQDIKNSGWPHIFLIDTPTRAMYFFRVVERLSARKGFGEGAKEGFGSPRFDDVVPRQLGSRRLALVAFRRAVHLGFDF